MKEKAMAVVSLAAAASLVLSACGGAGTAPSQAQPEAGTAASQAAAASSSSGTPAADPFGKYEEPVEITLVRAIDPNAKFKEGQTIESNAYLDLIKETFNIDVKYDWVAAGADYDQKLNLSISSGSLPDALMAKMTPFRAMIKYDQIQDITEPFNNYACDIMKSFYKSGGDALKEITEVDGKIMTVPATAPKAGGFNEMWIRQDWLDKLELEAPKTMADLKNVAKAFIEKDPDGNGKNDTIGIIGPANGGHLTGTTGNQWGLDPLFGAYQSFPGYWIKDESGSVTYGSITAQTKEALTAIADLYKEGLIDPEMLIRDDSLQPLLDDKCGIAFGPWWTGYTLVDAFVGAEDPDNWQAYAYPLAEDGKYYANMGAPASDFMVVNKNYEHPEAAIKIVNLLLRDEAKWVADGWNQDPGTSAAYPLYSVFDNVDEIEVSYDILSKYLKGETKIEDVDFTTHKLLEGDMNAIKALKKEPLDDFNIDNWDMSNTDLVTANLPRLVSIMVGDKPLSTQDNIVEVYTLTNAQTDTMASRWANLKKLEDETFAKIIMGQASIDAFDAFTAEWRAQGGDKIIGEVTELIS